MEPPIKHQEESYWTVPNLLSAYRILVFPFLLYLILDGQRLFFAGMLALSLLTDVLDGYIARKWKQQTRFGALLDSWADYGSYILGGAGIWYFEMDFVLANRWSILLYAALFLGSFLANWIRFGRIVGLHLYSAKIAGYLQGIFFLVLLWHGPLPVLYWPMILVGCLSEFEQILVLFWLKTPRSNARGLYWILKNP